MVKIRYLSKKICEKCKGKCCKCTSGILHPKKDFQDITIIKIYNLLKTGKYSVDWWDDDPRENKDEFYKVNFIRPAHKGIKDLLDPSWGGECVFLEEKGCLLPPRKRPYGCRMLEPKEEKSCIAHEVGTKQELSVLWIPYQEMIEEAIRRVNNFHKNKKK